MPAWVEGWKIGTPDLVVSMPAEYVVRADGPDVFRSFVIPIPVTRARYVRAIEFQPGNARVVHHANLGVDRTAASRRLDARDPEPGYAGGMVLEARYPEGQLLGWTPGQAPHTAPADMAWRVDPGSDLVVQLHLQPTGRPEPVRVSVGRLGDRSFRLEYDLFGVDLEHLATAATVHVSVDPATGRSTGISPPLRALLVKYAQPQ